MKIQIFLILQQLKMYSQILTIIRDVEWGLKKKKQDNIQKKLAKGPSQLMGSADSDRPLNASLAKQPL